MEADSSVIINAPLDEQKMEHVEVIEAEDVNATNNTAAGSIYQYVANPTDIIDPVNPTQYYEGEELIATALTDEDRKLAAALVDVHYKNQQAPPSGSVITTAVDDSGATYTIHTAEGNEIEGITYIHQDESTQESHDDTEKEVKPTELLVASMNQPATRIIFKSSDGSSNVKVGPASSKKTLPHKKRIAPSPAKNIKTYVSCSKCGDLFTTEAELNTHKFDVHGLKVKPTKPKAPTKKAAANPFHCQLCDDSFADQMVFFEHLKSHYEPKKEQKIEVSDDDDDRDYDDGTVHTFDTKEEEDDPVVKTVYVTETPDGLEYEGSVKSKSSSVKAIYQCGECHRQFSSQKWMENHMKSTHFKLPEEFSETEDMMVLDDKSNIVIRSWSPLGTTLLSQESHPSSYLTTGYTGVLDSNMTSQQYEAFETINVQLDGNNISGDDPKTISVTLVPIHEASTEGEIIAASSTEDWKGTVVLLEDKEMNKPAKRKKIPRAKKEKKKLICEYCSREFKYRNTLVYHLRSHTGEKPHMCDGCGKSFFTTTALKVHSRIHEGLKPYPCDICGRAFRQWGDLKYHKISLHTDLKAFQCEFCGKEFARKYSLIVHRRIHTGERNYVCEFCNKAFRASSYLQNHRRIHTGEKPHFCPVCNKLFRVRSDMKRHLNTHNVDASKYLTVTGCQTGVMQSRVKKEPKVVYEETTETYEDVPRPPRGGKRGRQPVPMPQHDSEPLSSDSSNDEDMEEVQNDEEGSHHAQQHNLRGRHHQQQQQQIHHMEEVYTSKGMYVWVDE